MMAYALLLFFRVRKCHVYISWQTTRINSICDITNIHALFLISTFPSAPHILRGVIVFFWLLGVIVFSHLWRFIHNCCFVLKLVTFHFLALFSNSILGDGKCYEKNMYSLGLKALLNYNPMSNNLWLSHI